MKDLLHRAAALAQRLWRSKPVRAVVGRAAMLTLVVMLSPQIVAVWRILLAGPPADQGFILVIGAVLVFAISSRRRIRQLKKQKDDGSQAKPDAGKAKPKYRRASRRNRRKGR